MDEVLAGQTARVLTHTRIYLITIHHHEVQSLAALLLGRELSCPLKREPAWPLVADSRVCRPLGVGVSASGQGCADLQARACRPLTVPL